MNNSKAPKIVVAVGLVAVYGAVFAYVMLREKPVVDVGPTPAAAPAAQMASEFAQPSAFDPALAGSQAITADSSGVAEPAIAMTATPASDDGAPVNGIGAPPPQREPAAAREPAPAPVPEQSVEQAAAIAAPVVPEEEMAVEVPGAASEVVGVSEEPAKLAGDSSDSRITADVKAQIEAVAPEGSVDVTTRDGVVELAGSVPSEEQAARVWLAARNVPAVRDVDVSGLMIGH